MEYFKKSEKSEKPYKSNLEKTRELLESCFDFITKNGDLQMTGNDQMAGKNQKAGKLLQNEGPESETVQSQDIRFKEGDASSNARKQYRDRGMHRKCHTRKLYERCNLQSQYFRKCDS